MSMCFSFFIASVCGVIRYHATDKWTDKLVKKQSHKSIIFEAMLSLGDKQ